MKRRIPNPKRRGLLLLATAAAAITLGVMGLSAAVLPQPQDVDGIVIQGSVAKVVVRGDIDGVLLLRDAGLNTFDRYSREFELLFNSGYRQRVRLAGVAPDGAAEVITGEGMQAQFAIFERDFLSFEGECTIDFTRSDFAWLTGRVRCPVLHSLRGDDVIVLDAAFHSPISGGRGRTIST